MVDFDGNIRYTIPREQIEIEWLYPGGTTNHSAPSLLHSLQRNGLRQGVSIAMFNLCIIKKFRDKVRRCALLTRHQRTLHAKSKYRTVWRKLSMTRGKWIIFNLPFKFPTYDIRYEIGGFRKIFTSNTNIYFY